MPQERAGAGLFENDRGTPLAARLRPKALKEVVGQDHLLKDGGVLGAMIREKRLSSLLLWGPPGTGKTTLAKILADSSGMRLVSLSAVMSNLSEVRKIFEEAEHRREVGEMTCLFVDEIHRFSRAQQDGFLPRVEEGVVTLIGATTENPSFALRAALLSRMRVCVLRRLDIEALSKLLLRAESVMGRELHLTEKARELLLTLADGDGRYLLNLVEEMMLYTGEGLDEAGLLERVEKRRPVYDKEDNHYNLISALHKSLRSSDVDASLYWCARMLEGGDDPLYIARRLIRFAYEDVGMGDPQAAVQAFVAWETWHRLGSPEGDLALMQAVVYLATAPKSNSIYRAHNRALAAARKWSSLTPPKHILNAPTDLMKRQGYGKGYVYDHDVEDSFSGQNCFPEEMSRESLYRPQETGFEREICKRLKYWERLREKRSGVSRTKGEER